MIPISSWHELSNKSNHTSIEPVLSGHRLFLGGSELLGVCTQYCYKISKWCGIPSIITFDLTDRRSI